MKRAGPAELRRRAEQRLLERQAAHAKDGAPSARMSMEDGAKLVHELQVHEIELEMQNEELLRARGELEEAVARYTDLYDVAPVGYFTLARDGTIREVNLPGAAMVGVERSRLLSRRFGVFVADADRPVFNALMAKAFASVADASCELELAAGASGDVPRCMELTAIVSSRGEECRLAMADVTERKRAEDRLRASQRMEAVGQLAGGVAHDFNNLLTIILANVEIAERDLDNPERLRRALGDCRAASERAAALTRQLLAFTRKQVVQPRVVDVHAVLRGLANMLQSLAGEANKVIVDVAEEECPVEIDPAQLEHAVVNLVINARDAMPSGGQIAIAACNVDIDERAARRVSLATGPFVRLTVRDSGTGMDKRTLARIFDPFFTTKPTGRGTGLGLFNVLGIFRQAGGGVTVHSEPGKGATFDCYVPRLAPSGDRVSSAPVGTEPSQGGTETILLVEDEEALCRVATRMLTTAGYTVLAATSPPEAVRLCDAHAGAINLVLTDVVMPGMTGVALAGLLTAQHPTLKVIYMSGYLHDALAIDGVLAPNVRFIGKPFSSELLRRKVREVLDAPEG